jgi:hypothetical protein
VVVWVQVVLASHNVASVRRAIRTADALGLARKDERLQFALLKVDHPCNLAGSLAEKCFHKRCKACFSPSTQAVETRPSNIPGGSKVAFTGSLDPAFSDEQSFIKASDRSFFSLAA